MQHDNLSICLKINLLFFVYFKVNSTYQMMNFFERLNLKQLKMSNKRKRKNLISVDLQLPWPIQSLGRTQQPKFLFLTACQLGFRLRGQRSQTVIRPSPSCAPKQQIVRQTRLTRRLQTKKIPWTTMTIFVKRRTSLTLIKLLIL